MRDTRPGTHRVYVLRLRDGALYVGSTGLSVRERARNHRVGYKAARACRVRGVQRVEWALTLKAPSGDGWSIAGFEAAYARKLRRQFPRVEVIQH